MGVGKVGKLGSFIAIVVILYLGSIFLLGFRDVVSPIIAFSRIAISLAVLIIYLPLATTIFKEIPAPRRDYLILGIILTWLSAVLFSLWNMAGLTIGVDTRVATSPIAGFFSLLLVIGGVFHFIAPGTYQITLKIIAIIAGAILATVIGGISWYYY